MFSGIIEAQCSVLQFEKKDSSARIQVQKPAQFDDLRIGDSIAANGVCLTLVDQDSSTMAFDLGPETLRVTGWNETFLLANPLNLERSLKVNSRMHGHFVAGHVDEVGTVRKMERTSDCLVLWVGFSDQFASYVWKKGSVAVNGVSLTVNEVVGLSFQVTLIPETLRRTNLGLLTEGDKVTLEADSMARGLVHFLQSRKAEA